MENLDAGIFPRIIAPAERSFRTMKALAVRPQVFVGLDPVVVMS
jgi:hypothetical protein